MASLAAMAATASADEAFANAKRVWENSKDRKEYRQYAKEFVELNNRLELDQKRCYGMARGPVELMLVITHDRDTEFAKIEQEQSGKKNLWEKFFGP